MEASNSVYIAMSLDGYIAGEDDNIDFLESVTIPEGTDMGWDEFMSRIDALVMGRKTFETVCGFDVEWPYDRPVYVLSTTLDSLPEAYSDKAHLVKGSLPEILRQIHSNGHLRLYIDGGTTIQRFLEADLIDDMILTVFPILLGGGSSLFGNLPKPLPWKLLRTQTFVDALVQHHYARLR